MEHLWELHRVVDGYRLPLGPSRNFIPVIDRAMRRFRPAIYRGVHEEGLTQFLV